MTRRTSDSDSKMNTNTDLEGVINIACLLASMLVTSRLPQQNLSIEHATYGLPQIIVHGHAEDKRQRQS